MIKKREERSQNTHVGGALSTISAACMAPWNARAKPTYETFLVCVDRKRSEILLVSGNSTPIVEHDVHTFSCNNWTSRRCQRWVPSYEASADPESDLPPYDIGGNFEAFVDVKLISHLNQATLKGSVATPREIIYSDNPKSSGIQNYFSFLHAVDIFYCVDQLIEI